MDPLGNMSEYQLLGDSFGYGGYGSNTGQPGQPGAAPIGSSQGPVGSSMMMMGSGPGSSGYPHHLQGHPSRYHLGSDPSKGMTSQYPYGPPTAPSQSSQLMSGRPGQYGSTDPRGYPDHTSHLSLSGPQSSPLPPSGYPSSRVMAPYPEQRLTGPPTRPPVHPMASHPSYSGYSATSQGYPGGSSDLWGPSQTIPPHLQTRGPYPGYSGASGSSSGARGQFSVSQSDQYGTSSVSGRPTYFPTGPTGQGPPPSVGGHIPSESSYSQSSSAFNSTGRPPSSSSQRQQSQYSAFTSGPLQPPLPPPPSAASNPRYSQQYYGSTSSTSSYPDVPSQSRMYGPNSPGYRAPYPGPSSSQMSPRRPTPTPPAGSPMPPTSRTPDRVGAAASSVSQSQSGFSTSSLTGSSTTSTPGGPSNSLAQLEQMVGGNSMAPSTGIKSSSQAAAGPPPGSGSYYSQSMSGPSINSSQSAPYFPVPSSVQSSQQPSSYYSSYPQNQGGPPSGSWPGSQPSPSAPPSGPSSNANNTHSGTGNGQPNMAFSPASQQSSLRSPQQPSHQGPGSSPASNVNSSSIKSPMTGSQFGMYDTSFSSPASSSDPTQGNQLHPAPSAMSKPNQYEGSSFGSPMTPKSKSDDQKSEPTKQMNKEDKRKTDGDYTNQESSQTHASPGFFGIRSVSTENSSSSMSPASQPSSAQDSTYIARQQPSFDSQSSYMNQNYSQAPNHQSSFNTSQSMGQFSNSYGDSSMSYEMQGMNSTYCPPPEPRMFDSSYANSSMDNMGAGTSSMGEYSGEMSSMSGYGTGPSPYDEPFSSEPPGPKRKGKGRPKKDPLEPKPPKEPKKPRQPRAPRGSGRGRGRGAKANQGDRMPEPGDMYGEGSYPMHNEMYGAPNPMAPPPNHMSHPGVPSMIPGHPNMGHPSLDPYQSSLMPPSDHLPVHPHGGVHPSLVPPPIPPPMNPPVAGYSDIPSISNQALNNTMSTTPSIPPHVEKLNEINTETIESQSLPTPLPQSELVSAESESVKHASEMEVSKSELSSDLDDHSQISEEKVQTETECSIEATGDVSNEQEMVHEPVVMTSELPSENSIDATPIDEKVLADDEPQAEQVDVPIEAAPSKKKSKKRKVKPEAVIEESCQPEDVTALEKPPKEKKAPKEKKPKKPPAPKKPKKGKKGTVDDASAVDLNSELDQSQLLSETATDTSLAQPATDLDSTVASASGFDDVTQEEGEEGSQLDSSISESPTKGKGKGKGKGTPKGPKKPKLKDGSGGKRKLPKITLAKFKGRKKKRLGSDDNASDVEKTPPPSPEEAESGVQKRRSGRLTKRTKYLDEVDIDLSGDEQKVKDDAPVAAMAIDDTMVVEKIMVSRMGTRELEPENEEEEEKFKADGKAPTVEVEEFYVKYKNLSYLHCDWRTEEELEKGDKRINQKIKRFKQKKDSNLTDFLDDEPFNPDYCEVDRILDVNIIEDMIPNPSQKEKIIETPVAAIAVKDEKNSVEEQEKMDIQTEIDHNNENKREEEEVKDDPESDKKSETNEKEAETEKSQNAAIKDEGEMGEEKSEQEENKEKQVVECTSNEKDEKVEEKIEVKKRIVRHYLVKWQALSYEECTWELEDDLDPQKVANFWKFRELPSKEKQRVKKRPKAADWKQLPESPVYKSGNTLREYQLEGLNWLTFCWYNGRNCILADEMGLGKTIQSLTLINEMVKYGIHSPFLVIAPLSTIGNWQREFETWTDLNVITYHGSSASRNMLQEYEMFYKNEKGERLENIYKFQVMITTFEVVLTDCLELREIWWRCCVIDEAHRLKNRNCKLLEGLRLLNIEHRVLLTGTPLQNNVEELFSLLNFLEPTQFGSPESFMLEFGDLKTEEQVDKLKAILKPMMLRRLKEDVEKSLAPKEETIVEVELTNIQKKYYRAIMEKNFQFLSKGGTYANVPNLMNIMMELRKCCIHPFLINSAEEQIVHDYRAQHGDEADAQLKCMVQASGKLVLIDKLLPRLKAEGHRVLIFSQMVRCLDILEDYVVHKKYPYERIDGRVRGNLRQAAIDRYSKPGSDRFVFLLCTRAGGLGINLTAADTVIIFDSDWNPQNDLQAQARCHRIGQSKAVKVYRLICRNTYEREMFDKASLKLGLDKAVLQSMNTGQKMDGPMSKKEVEELLRKGAYGAVMDDDNAGDKFCEEDIEQILLRRTQVITIDNTEAKGSTFSKATFAATENRSDIDINDPNFWEKWAKKADIDSEEILGKNDLIVEEPRRRTQTRRFGQDDGLLEISEGDSSDEDEEGISGRTRRGGRGRLGRDKKGKKGKGYRDGDRDEDYAQEFGIGNWTKAECFAVEKGLLTYGFGRWEQILSSSTFRRALKPSDVEDVARTILLFSLQNYRGDEKVKSSIWELITPSDVQNGGGSEVSSPTPGKGRKSKKVKKTVAEELTTADWTLSDKCNPEINLNDESYRKHLARQANRLLLRIKNLNYLKSEVVGEFCDDIDRGVPASDIPIPPVTADGEPPAPWWDEECDKSLLIGVFKHGYDHYNSMRQDANLCFLARCGPPDGAALLAEIQDNELSKLEEDEEPEVPVLPDASKVEEAANSDAQAETAAEVLLFPSRADLNQRFRRLLTAHQRQFRRQEIRMAQQARHQQRLEKLEKFEAQIKERESKKREQAQKKWSRREESDFFRVVSSYGVEFDRRTQQYNWDKFKTLSRLEKKVDETISEYYKAFYAMCKRVTGRPVPADEDNLQISVDPITEDRAVRCLARIDLLSKIREEILPSSDLNEKLTLCQSSIDLPEWWICGKHDKDLLIGAAKYGLNRLDLNLMHDPDLSFKDVLRQAEEEAAALMKAEADALARDNLITSEVKNVINALVDEVVNLATPADIVSKLGVKDDQKDSTDHPLENGLDDDGAMLLNGDSKSSKEEIGLNGDKTDDFMKKENPEDVNKVDDVKATRESAVDNPALIAPVTGPVTLPQPRALRWPKDRVLQMRLEQLAYLFEKNEWPSVRHQFFTNFGPPVSTTPSVMTAESSPRAMSPGSLSSMSREPTPHPTPDNTPRRDAVSPLLECLFTEPEGGERKRKRRRRRYDTPPMVPPQPVPDQMVQDRSGTKLTPEQIARFSDKGFAAKLRNLLSQNIDQQVSQSQSQNFMRHQDQQAQSSSNKRGSTSQSLLNQATNFMSPLFANLPFMNLREDIRNEILGNEKTASLLLGSLSSRMHQQSMKQNLMPSSSSTGHGSSGPPPAHQSSSKHRGGQMDAFDFSRFKGIAPPAPAHKTPKIPPPPPKEVKVAPSVLDLSGGLPTKRSTRNSSSSHQQQPSQSHPSTSERSGRKRIGSRIDALALNLQAKKMMEEKVEPDEPNILSEIAQKSEKRRSTRESSLDALLGSRSSRSSGHQSSGSTPPAAHSSSSTQSKIDSLNEALFGRSSRPSNSSNNPLGMLDPTKLLQGLTPKVDQAAALQSYKTLSQDLKKWLEDHPEFVAANPSLAAAAAAAMALNPPTTSSMPANTELLELPEGRRRGRRPKTETSVIESPGVLGEETVSVVNRLTGKKLTGPKAPPLKYLQEWLEKNPNYEVDPKWTPVPRERFDFKTPSAVPLQSDRSSHSSSSGIRTRTSDRSSRSSSRDDPMASLGSNSSSSSSRRTTAASLLAQAHNSSQSGPSSKSDRSSDKNNSGAAFGFPSSSMNPMNAFNPNLLASLPSMKMFMDQAAAASAATSSTKTSSSNTSSSTTSSNTMNSALNPFGFPFGGLANMNLFGSNLFPGFNIPGFPPGQIPGFPGSEGDGKKSKEGSSSSERSSSRSSEKSSREKSSRDKSNNSSSGSMSSAERNAAAAAASLFGSAGSLPYMYPNPNFMFPGLPNLSGLTMPGSSSSPFASLAQSGLMNGLGGLGSASPSSSKHGSKSDKGKSSSSRSSSGAPSGLSLSTASSLLSSTGLHPSSAAAAAAMGDSDDESLKSLMGHDDEEDLNGDMEDPPEKDDDSDFELGSRKRSRSSKNKDKDRSSRKHSSSSKSKT